MNSKLREQHKERHGHIKWRMSCGWSASYVELERYWNYFMIISLEILTFCYSDFRKPLKILKV